MKRRLYEHLLLIYGPERAGLLTERLSKKVDDFQLGDHPSARPSRNQRVSEKDAILITYGDMVRADGERPLTTLADFVQQQLRGVVNTIHILPFFPYSSDDGFSVIDYTAVNLDWGTWQDIAQIGQNFRLMFDAVVNHISVQSDWFQGFLRRERPYADYFTSATPKDDLSQVFRPRTQPLLTPFTTSSGSKYVWTTFSADQVDLNFANPDVLFAVIDVLLFYVAQGAEFIRLDAIAYIWKEVGTSCIHLPQTHEIIKLMRSVLDIVAPQVSLITETNVPHSENISYFGNGRDEAQLVYNFSLPPLTLHAFHSGSASILAQWADTLDLPSNSVTYFNFLASHDGIGLEPARGLLSDTAVQEIAARIEAVGGFVSYKTNSDGSQSPYELNCNYLDALGDPEKSEEPVALKAKRFLAAQAIMLTLRGVPGIYFHSLFGSQNWLEGVVQTGQKRSINRQKLQQSHLEIDLANPQSLRHLVFAGYKKLLQVRTTQPAFHPDGGQEVLFCHEAVFGVWRLAPNGRSRILCLQNVSNNAHNFVLEHSDKMMDLLSEQKFGVEDGRVQIKIEPYGVLWLI